MYQSILEKKILLALLFLALGKGIYQNAVIINDASNFTFGDKTWVGAHILTRITGKK